MSSREPAQSPRTPERLPRTATLLRVAFRKATAVADGVRIIAGARGMTPWARPTPLPAVEYPKVFVVGCPRSGTTWVADILGRHPSVIGGRESHIYPAVTGSIERRGRLSVMAWAQLFYGIERGRKLGRPTGLYHYVDRPTLAQLGRSVLAQWGTDQDVVTGLVRAVLDSYFVRMGGTPDHVLVEKTPLHIMYAEQILSTFPEARIVEVVRDGRDVCVSMQMRAAYVSAFPATRPEQIDTWVRCVRHGLALRRNPDLSHRVSVVRYEDLKDDPAGEITRLFDETGLEGSPQLVADIVAETDIDRYPSGAGQFRFRGQTGTWVDHFTAEDDRLFRASVGDLFGQLGYVY